MERRVDLALLPTDQLKEHIFSALTQSDKNNPYKPTPLLPAQYQTSTPPS